MSSHGPVKVLTVYGTVFDLATRIPQALAEALVPADDLLHVNMVAGEYDSVTAFLIVRDHEWSGWAPPDPSEIDS